MRVKVDKKKNALNWMGAHEVGIIKLIINRWLLTPKAVFRLSFFFLFNTATLYEKVKSLNLRLQPLYTYALTKHNIIFKYTYRLSVNITTSLEIRFTCYVLPVFKIKVFFFNFCLLLSAIQQSCCSLRFVSRRCSQCRHYIYMYIYFNQI